MLWGTLTLARNSQMLKVDSQSCWFGVSSLHDVTAADRSGIFFVETQPRVQILQHSDISGFPRSWKILEKIAVMEKSWNMKLSQKGMEKSWNCLFSWLWQLSSLAVFPCVQIFPCGSTRSGKKLSSALRVNKPFPWTRKSYGFDARPPTREVLIEQCWIFPRGSPHPHMEISKVTSWRRGISRNVQRVHHIHSIVWEKYRSGACSWYHPARVLCIYGKAPPVRVTRTGTRAGRPAWENPDTWKHGLCDGRACCETQS